VVNENLRAILGSEAFERLVETASRVTAGRPKALMFRASLDGTLRLSVLNLEEANPMSGWLRLSEIRVRQDDDPSSFTGEIIIPG
jgi:hypothetical protein